MKTKFFKTGMPLMVFMLAVMFAFATQSVTSENESLVIPGYIFENGQCIPATECNDEGVIPCEQGEFQVYKTNLGGTSCLMELTHRP